MICKHYYKELQSHKAETENHNILQYTSIIIGCQKMVPLQLIVWLVKINQKTISHNYGSNNIPTSLQAKEYKICHEHIMGYMYTPNTPTQWFLLNFFHHIRRRRRRWRRMECSCVCSSDIKPTTHNIMIVMIEFNLICL
jgi:hypothetical protein